MLDMITRKASASNMIVIFHSADPCGSYGKQHLDLIMGRFFHVGNFVMNFSPTILGGGFKYFLFSPRKLGKITILTNIFQRG